jgi:NHL repeat
MNKFLLVGLASTRAVAVDDQGRVYIGDRENQRIQIFDADGKFIHDGPASVTLRSADHARPAHLDGRRRYDRIIGLDQNGKILGAFGGPGHKPGQFAWAHFMALGPDQTIDVADVLNRRFQALAYTAPSRVLTSYIPSLRRCFGVRYQASDGPHSRQ